MFPAGDGLSRLVIATVRSSDRGSPVDSATHGDRMTETAPEPRRNKSGSVAGLVTVVSAALLILAFFLSQGPGSQTDRARDLMREACGRHVVAALNSPADPSRTPEIAVSPAQLVVSKVETSFFSNDVRFEGTHPTGTWSCWGDLREGEMQLHSATDYDAG